MFRSCWRAQRRFFATALASILLLAGPLSEVQAAQEYPITATLENGQAQVEAFIPLGYVESKDRLAKEILNFFSSPPLSANAVLFSPGAFTPSGSTQAPMQRSRAEHLFLLRVAQQKFMPESLFSMTEEHTVCNGQSGCKDQTVFRITGPIHSYHPVVQAVSPSSSPTSLNGSYEIQISLEPQDSSQPTRRPSKLTIALTLSSRALLQYTRQLHEQGLIQRAWLEKELLGGFLLWGRAGIQTFVESHP